MADPRDSGAACRNVSYDVGDIGSASPPNSTGPTRVDVFLFVQAIDSIGPRTNAFRLQAFGGVVWCDPRLAFEPERSESPFRVLPGSLVREEKATFWWPGVFIPSQLGAPEITSDRVMVFSDGTVEFRAKYNMRLIADFDFRRFPFDRQRLRIDVEPFLWQAGRLDLRPAEDRTGFNRGFEIPEWVFIGSETRMEAIGDAADGPQRFVMEIEIGRKSGFYFWKVLLPLVIVFGVAWSTFWLTRDALAQRQRQSATALLTLVAYQFVASGDLPRVSYLTILDRVIVWTFIMIGATLINNVMSARRYRKNPDLGLAWDRTGRWAYPLVFAVGLGGILLRYYLF